MRNKCRLLLLVLLATNCPADTFNDRQTGRTFVGYATQVTKHDLTLVYIEGKNKPEYVDIAKYEVERNYLGRKKQVAVFCIDGPVEMMCEAEAFANQIVTAANQGPLFILIEIDSPGGRFDCAQRISSTIAQLGVCKTVGFIKGGKHGGAHGPAATIALACDELYMTEAAVIRGCRTPNEEHPRRAARRSSPADKYRVENYILAERPDEEMPAAYVGALAERKGRPAVIAKAMYDDKIRPVETQIDGKRAFVERDNIRSPKDILKIWGTDGDVLNLSASEAAACGIADKIVPSRAKLLDSLDSDDARTALNTDWHRAIRQFQKAKRKFDEIVSSVVYQEKRVDTLLSQLDRIESDIRLRASWLRSWAVDRRHPLWLWDALGQRAGLINELIVLSTALGRDYDKAIELGSEYPDLNADLDALKEGFHNTSSRLEDMRRRAAM